MVSKARLDLPDPESPVMTTSELRGSLRWRSLRLCSRAPEMTISSLCGGTSSRLASGLGVHVVQKTVRVVEVVVLAQIAGCFLPRGATERHVEGDQASPFGHAGLRCGARGRRLGIGFGLRRHRGRL